MSTIDYEAGARELASYRPHLSGSDPIPTESERETASEVIDAAVKNIPVGDDITALRAEVAEVKAILEPLVPFMAALPELMGQVGPILDGLKKSPVLKMMGVSL